MCSSYVVMWPNANVEIDRVLMRLDLDRGLCLCYEYLSFFMTQHLKDERFIWSNVINIDVIYIYCNFSS